MEQEPACSRRSSYGMIDRQMVRPASRGAPSPTSCWRRAELIPSAPTSRSKCALSAPPLERSKCAVTPPPAGSTLVSCRSRWMIPSGRRAARTFCSFDQRTFAIGCPYVEGNRRGSPVGLGSLVSPSALVTSMCCVVDPARTTCAERPGSIASRADSPFGHSVSPVPACGDSFGARSKTSASMPTLRSALQQASPPSPPPITPARRAAAGVARRRRIRGHGDGWSFISSH
mmetsp:Transcript_29513/g.98634  ORF Transcript_29513/g.98634 Transcript_29513/m.98634 type:complete len:230 (-) Transcript_29513:8-697(-)